MLDFHREQNADLTVGALRVPQDAARHFGVMEIDTDERIIGFEEKVAQPRTMPSDPQHCLASMGIYVVTARFLFEQLCQDANSPGSSHDFGRDVIPSIIDSCRVYAFPFRDENRKTSAYWRDVGTLDAYYEANMDLVSVDPELNMYDEHWPIRTYHRNYPPPKFVFSGKGGEDRCGHAMDSIVCQGSICSGGEVDTSILGPNVRVNSYARVEGSILFDGVDIGRHAKIRKAIIDKGIHIPPGIRIGYDADEDRERGFTVSENGVVVIASSDGVEHLERASSLAAR
jgi:glucose-1-phosphate adenylyltransferase